MTLRLIDLVDQYEEIAKKIREEIAKIQIASECNCSDREEVDIVTYEGHELAVERLCGNCGGVIWDRQL